MPTLDSRTALTAPAVADLIHVQDVSDTTDGSSGTSKKVTLADLRELMQALSNAEPIVLYGGTGNAPWRVQSSNGAANALVQNDQVLLFVYNTEYDQANSAWKARDVDGLPVIRHAFESLWNDSNIVNQLEWNLDIALPGNGAPTFHRIYGMDYYYDTAAADTAAWQWRSKATGGTTLAGGWDMILNATSLRVGANFTVNISTGVIAIGNAVGTGTPTANRTVQISVGGSTYYLLASTAAS